MNFKSGMYFNILKTLDKYILILSFCLHVFPVKIISRDLCSEASSSCMCSYNWFGKVNLVLTRFFFLVNQLIPFIFWSGEERGRVLKVWLRRLLQKNQINKTVKRMIKGNLDNNMNVKNPVFLPYFSLGQQVFLT